MVHIVAKELPGPPRNWSGSRGIGSQPIKLDKTCFDTPEPHDDVWLYKVGFP